MFMTVAGRQQFLSARRFTGILSVSLWVLGFVPAGYGQTDSVSQLIARLKAKDADIRSSAAQDLGEFKDSRAVEPLIAALRDPVYIVRTYVATALGEIKDARAVGPLIAALKDPDSGVRSEAARALGGIKDPRAIGPLITALKDSDDTVRWRASIALGEIKDPRAIEPLIAALRDSEVEDALVKIGAPAVPFLIAAVDDPHWNVQFRVAWALDKIGDPRAVPRLLAALSKHEAAVVAGAMSFFVGRGEPGSEVTLIEVFEKSGGSGLQEFLNSGNPLLEAIARKYAAEHGYHIILGDVSSPRWGAKR
jgi:HEAT repeat protein